MKSFPFFLISVFLTFNLTAQTPPAPRFSSPMDLSKPAELLNISTNNANIRSGFRSDQDDVLDSTYHWTWDVNNWLLNSGEFYTVDGNGNILTLLQRSYESGVWVDQSLSLYSYDTDQQLINILQQAWDGSAWVSDTRNVYTYDGNGNLTSNLLQNWNGADWDNGYMQVFTYDGNNNRITAQTSLWIGGAWSSGSRHFFSYDAQNRLTVHLVQSFILDWTNAQQVLYTYNAFGKLEMNLGQTWNGISWDDAYRNLYNYDANHNLISVVVQNPDGSDWVNVLQYVYAYDANNNITLLLTQNYMNDEWVNIDRFVATYDAEQNRVSEIYQLWDNMWINQDSFHYYYSIFSSVASVIPDIFISVYPNPASTSLHLQLREHSLEESIVRIYSSTGVEMTKSGMSTNGDNTLDISGLVAGSYYVLIQSENGRAIRKFIKL